MTKQTQMGLSHTERIDLAHEHPFSIGPLTIDPAFRRIVHNDGREDFPEPRVMQVLVALARAQGGIVTRDELIECCWEGRIVGEDAIDRTLSRLRRIALDFAPDSFKVETIRKVGHRLVASNLAFRLGETGELPRASMSIWSRRLVTAGLLGTCGLGASALIWSGRKPQREMSPEAHRLYTRGIEHRGQASLQQSEQSVAYLREATRLEPEFAEAWGALAWGYRGLLEYGPRPDSSRITNLARSAAHRALELDSTIVDAQAALLLLKPFFGNWSEIEMGCRRLLDQHPGHSIPLYNLGLTLCEAGRWRDAIPMLSTLAEQQPFWPLVSHQLFLALMNAGRIGEAEEVLEYALKRWPRHGFFWLSNHLNLISSDRNDEAMAFANDLSKRPIGMDRTVGLALVMGQALANGSAADRKIAISKLAAYGKDEPLYFPCAVLSIGLLGSIDTAFQMLEGYYFGRGQWAAARWDRPQTGILFMMCGAALRRDARFPELVRKIGLERYWTVSKRRPDYQSAN